MSFRDKGGRVVMAPRVQNFIMALIIFNALTLGLETSSSIRNSHGQVLSIIDQLVLSVFGLEILFDTSFYIIDFLSTLPALPLLGAILLIS